MPLGSLNVNFAVPVAAPWAPLTLHVTVVSTLTMMVCGQVTLALGAPCGRERLFDGRRCRGPRDLDRSGREFTIQCQ